MKFRTIIPLLASAVLLFAFLLILSLAQARPVALAAPSTATWYVDAASGDDSNDCLTPGTACASIAATVVKAIDGDTIEIAAGTYNEHEIQLSEQLTLNGAGIGNTILDAGGAGRAFSVGSTVVVSGLLIQNGQTASGSIFTEGGGAIFTSSGAHLTLRNAALQSNHAVGEGGAIFNIGNLVLDNTQVLSNTAGGYGGGIYNYNLGVITITQSLLAHNTALGSQGGGIYAGGTALTIRDSTLDDNSAATFGGGLAVLMTGPTELDGVTLSGNQAAEGAGLFSQQGTITATNLTVSGNSAANNYGGIYITGPDTSLFLKNGTIANNSRTNAAGSGFNGLMTGNNAAASYVNTILAGNQENNCSSFQPPLSLGHNLADDYTCGLTQSGDQPGVDPLLGLLDDNGGPVATHALLPGSPAIDAGDDAQCPASDARGVPRPYDGDGDTQAVCDIGAVEAQHQLNIVGSTVLEGDSSPVTAVFTVTLAPTSALAVSVDYATLDGTATGGADYTPVSGTLIFNPGDTQQFINVQVSGDTDDELDETFQVLLSAPVNAELLAAQATGRIVDNDGLPTLSIADQTLLEGNTGSRAMQFQVSLSPASTSVVSVDYATANGTATAGSDYNSASGTLIFQPGQTSHMIAVDVLGDLVDEGASETFFVQLNSPSNAALANAQATGTITDDDSARLTQGIGPQILEGDSGFTPAVFNVSLSTPAAFSIHVDYEVSSGVGDTGALAGQDFVPISGTLTFQPGETLHSFTVQIIGDTLDEKDEIFWSLISNANVPIDANGSSATILNDDSFRIYLPLMQR